MIGKTINYPLPTVLNPATNDGSGVTITYSTTVSFISYDPATPSGTTGTLTISTLLTDFSKIGTFTIGLTLTTGVVSKEYTTTVTITNSAPIFT